MKIIFLLMLLMPLVLASSAGAREGEAGTRDIKSVPEAEWKRLSGMKIFFGHQSVGNNIIAGVSDLMREMPQIKLNLRETNEPRSFSGAVFAHAKVGENMKPISKNEAFRDYINGGIGGKADLAFYKYCYIDIKADTDVAALFKQYKAEMAALKARHPGTTLIHVTVPLTAVQSGWKARAKKLLGKPVGGYADNIRRNEFNQLLKKEYDGREPVFDLAAAEAYRPGGKRETFRANGREYLALAPEYASDGRHLNERGRRHIAGELLLKLLAVSAQGR